MALVEVSNNKWMIGLKPAVHMWPFVSSVKIRYHETTQLVLPLPKNAGKAYKKMKIEH